MLDVAISDDAIGRRPRRGRLALIAAGVLALLGPFVVAAPAQAGYYDESGYGYNPCSYRCGYPAYHYGYAPHHYGCSSCGCWHHCYSRSGGVYERRYRYVEREYVERRYGWAPHHYHRNYGYYPNGYYQNGVYGGGRPFPWGYGGVRGWRAPYGYGYAPSAYGYGEEPPRPPAPVWDGGYD